MKVTADHNERIHVLDAESNVMSVIRDIALSGLQEEAFYVLNIGDIVRKHETWKKKLPRVQPFYGKLTCNVSLAYVTRICDVCITYTYKV